MLMLSSILLLLVLVLLILLLVCINDIGGAPISPRRRDSSLRQSYTFSIIFS